MRQSYATSGYFDKIQEALSREQLNEILYENNPDLKITNLLLVEVVKRLDLLTSPKEAKAEPKKETAKQGFTKKEAEEKLNAIRGKLDAVVQQETAG